MDKQEDENRASGRSGGQKEFSCLHGSGGSGRWTFKSKLQLSFGHYSGVKVVMGKPNGRRGHPADGEIPMVGGTSSTPLFASSAVIASLNIRVPEIRQLKTPQSEQFMEYSKLVMVS